MVSRRDFGRRAPARGELGGARLNFLILVAVIALAAYSAYQYVPVARGAFLYRDLMQETVNKAAFRQDSPVAWAETQLRAAAAEYDLPADTRYEVQSQNGCPATSTSTSSTTRRAAAASSSSEQRGVAGFKFRVSGFGFVSARNPKHETRNS
jgi:hypothetical protein